MNNKLFVLVGPPAIGKSTYTKNTLAQLNPVIISRDEIVEQVTKKNGMTYNEYYKKLNDPSVKHLADEIENTLQNKFIQAINSGNNIVADMTHMNKKSRKKTLSLAQTNGYEKVAVVFKFEKAMIPHLQKLSKIREKELEQKGQIKVIPDHVFEQMIDLFEPVDTAEGFDTIVHIDPSPRIYGV